MTSNSHLYDCESPRSNVLPVYLLRMNGKTGYCMRSLNERPAILLSVVRYSKLVMRPSSQYCCTAARFSVSMTLGRRSATSWAWSSSRSWHGRKWVNNNNSIDFYLAHTHEIHINALYNTNKHKIKYKIKSRQGVFTKEW